MWCWAPQFEFATSNTYAMHNSVSDVSRFEMTCMGLFGWRRKSTGKKFQLKWHSIEKTWKFETVEWCIPEVWWNSPEHCSSCIVRAVLLASEWNWSCIRTLAIAGCDRWSGNFPCVDIPFPLFPPPACRTNTLLLSTLSQYFRCSRIWWHNEKKNVRNENWLTFQV